jgi:putative ABC transport system permease protein
MTESLLYALLAGLAGIVLAHWMVRGFTSLAVTLDRMDLGVQLSFPRLHEIAVAAPAIVFAAAASLAVGIFVGLVPAVWITRNARPQPLSERAATGSGGALRGRGLLVVSEIALATVLLIGGVLIVRSFVNLASVDAGFNPSGVLTFQIAIPAGRYPGVRMRELAEQLTERLRKIPGVKHAAYARQLPLVALRESAWFRKTPALPNPPPRQSELAPDARLVSRDYFGTMGIPVIAGRGFGEDDRDGVPRAMLINETLARREFPDGNPLGQIVFAGRDSQPWTIVGIVRDVRQFRLDQPPQPQFFVDARQWPADSGLFTFLGPYYSIRTGADTDALVSSIRAAARTIDPVAGVYNVASMDRLLDNSVSRQRLYAVFLGLFAAFAGLLAAAGIYGVMAYTVAQRTMEIGVRMALGATRSDVMRLVLRQSSVIACTGLLIGLALATVLTTQLKGLLFGLTALDVSTYAGVVAAFGVVATLAAYTPARRATRVDPMVALRRE